MIPNNDKTLNNNVKSIIKIIDSSGNLLDTTKGLDQLEQMGYRINGERHKLDMKNVVDDVAMDDIILTIKRSSVGIDIIAHIIGKRPSDDRNGRYYILYRNIEKHNLIEILKDFVYKIREETKKYSMEIKDNKDSLFIFESINTAINSYISYGTVDNNKFDAICKYFDKKLPLQLDTNNIENAIHFVVNLDSKIMNIKKDAYYILYMPTKTRRATNPDVINISIVQDRYIKDIEFTEKLKIFICDYEKNKIEDEIKNKVDTIQKEIEPGITNSHAIWRSRKIDLSSDIRKRLAENLYKTVNKFLDDIESERTLYGMSGSDKQSRDHNVKFKVSKRQTVVQRLFINFILLLLFVSIGFVSGMYVESNGIDIPYISNIMTISSDIVSTDEPILNNGITSTPTNENMIVFNNTNKTESDLDTPKVTTQNSTIRKK